MCVSPWRACGWSVHSQETNTGMMQGQHRGRILGIADQTLFEANKNQPRGHARRSPSTTTTVRHCTWITLANHQWEWMCIRGSLINNRGARLGGYGRIQRSETDRLAKIAYTKHSNSVAVTCTRHTPAPTPLTARTLNDHQVCESKSVTLYD
jgi:hypothetical protein